MEGLIRIGTNTLKNIALSFVIAKQLRGTGGPPESGFDFAFFRKRALTAAAVDADILLPFISAKK